MKKIIAIILLLPLFSACEKSGSSSDIGPGSTGQGGSLARFAIAGDYLYAVNGSKLKVFNIQDMENPVQMSQQNLNVNVETIFGRDPQTLFIGSTNGMFIYDISNPLSPQHLSTYQHIVSCDPVVANDEYAYVTLRSSNGNNFCNRDINQLDIIDISDLRNPRLVNTIELIHPIGLGLYGDTLLVCDQGVKVFDVTRADNIQFLNAIEDISAVDIIPYGNLMLIATETGLEQYRYKNKQLKFLSRI